MACWCLRLCLRAVAREYSASKYDIPLAQVDRQVALWDARAFSLLTEVLHFLRIGLMWSCLHALQCSNSSLQCIYFVV